MRSQLKRQSKLWKTFLNIHKCLRSFSGAQDSFNEKLENWALRLDSTLPPIPAAFNNPGNKHLCKRNFASIWDQDLRKYGKR